MIEFVATVGALAIAVILLNSGLRHSLNVGSLKDALDAQGSLPELVRPLAVRAVPASEVGLGVFIALALLTPDVLPLDPRWVFVATLALLLAYLLHGLFLIRSRSVVPCGCSAYGTPVNAWVVGRTSVLALLAVAPALAPEAILALTELDARVFIVASAGIAAGTVIWNVPEAAVDRTASSSFSPGA